MPSYVYFIRQSSGSIKIGVADDPEQRRADLQTCTSRKLAIVLLLPCADREAAFALEAELHERFITFKHRGEWYSRHVLAALRGAKPKPRSRKRSAKEGAPTPVIMRVAPVLGTCYVYFIQQGYGAIKIGVSEDPETRLAQLQTGCARTMRIIGAVPCPGRAAALGLEGRLHQKYGRFRKEGEWFHPRVLKAMKTKGRRLIGGSRREPHKGWFGPGAVESCRWDEVVRIRTARSSVRFQLTKSRPLELPAAIYIEPTP